MMNEPSTTKISRYEYFRQCFFLSLKLHFFFYQTRQFDFSHNEGTPAIQNKTNEGISKLLKQVRQLHTLLISTSE